MLDLTFCFCYFDSIVDDYPGASYHFWQGMQLLLLDI
jgi:hypothetical protein